MVATWDPEQVQPWRRVSLGQCRASQPRTRSPTHRLKLGRTGVFKALDKALTWSGQDITHDIFLI